MTTQNRPYQSTDADPADVVMCRATEIQLSDDEREAVREAVKRLVHYSINGRSPTAAEARGIERRLERVIEPSVRYLRIDPIRELLHALAIVRAGRCSTVCRRFHDA